MALQFTVSAPDRAGLVREAYRVADQFDGRAPLTDGLPWYRHSDNTNRVRFSYDVRPFITAEDGSVALWEADVTVTGWFGQ